MLRRRPLPILAEADVQVTAPEVVWAPRRVADDEALVGRDVVVDVRTRCVHVRAEILRLGVLPVDQLRSKDVERAGPPPPFRAEEQRAIRGNRRVELRPR